MIYFNKVLVDCGVSFKTIAGLHKQLSAILLTHEHGDHIKGDTIRKIAIANPSVKIFTPEYMVHKVKPFVKSYQIQVIEIGKVYHHDGITFSPVQLYHNVPNIGWRIMKDNFKIIHATDTVTLEGISAKGYDLYSLEFNFDAETIDQVIHEKEMLGVYVYEREAKLNHLSWQKAQEFFETNRNEKSELVKLHISSRYKEVTI